MHCILLVIGFPSSSDRCVAENQRTLALGTQSFFWRLFGSIPGPILFGAIFDSTCLFWQHQCGRRGNCWVYDNTALSVRAVVLAMLAMAGYITCVFFCWLFYPKAPEDSNAGGEGEKKVEKDSTALEEGATSEDADERDGGAVGQGDLQSRCSTASTAQLLAPVSSLSSTSL